MKMSEVYKLAFQSAIGIKLDYIRESEAFKEKYGYTDSKLTEKVKEWDKNSTELMEKVTEAMWNEQVEYNRVNKVF